VGGGPSTLEAVAVAASDERSAERGNMRISRLPPSLASALHASDLGVVVTGAGGWLGQAAVEMLAEVFGESAGQRLALFSSNERMHRLPSGEPLACRPFASIAELPARPWLFFHFAYVTRDRLGEFGLAEYVRVNRVITGEVIEAARRVKAAGLFVPSSGAVYRRNRELESDLVKNPYGVLKLEDEQAFAGLAHELGCRALIPRVFNLAGPFINKLGSYALSSLILAAQQGQPLSIRAAHRVVRSYIHVADLIGLALAILLEGGPEPIARFDTAGERAVEVGELATCIQSTLGTRLPIERPPLNPDRNTDDIYVGEREPMQSLMARYHIDLMPLEDQIRDTARYLGSLADTREIP
jgi:UDP-glucuronate decarboxylase